MRLKYLIPAVLFAAGAAHAQPISGLFSYQGRITNAGTPVTGTVDVRFSLWDSSAGGAQVGSTIDKIGTSIQDGLYNTDLNFGVDAFDGTERWLQIEVRTPSGSGSYVNLGRQQILCTPYAIQTRGLFVDDARNVGIGTTNPQAALHISNGDLRVDGGLGVYTNSGTDLLMGTIINASTGVYLVFRNITNGWNTLAIGTSEYDGAGFVNMFDKVNQETLTLDSDADDTDNGVAEGEITLRSRGGGSGGIVSVRNDAGDETISLLGGIAGNSGMLSMYHPSSPFPYIELAEDFDAGGGGVLSIDYDNAGNAGFLVDGNYAGTSSTALSVLGSGSSFAVFTDKTGNDAVFLANDAVRDWEILNEPGVASATSNSAVLLSGGVQTVLSRTITAPTSGYCIVIGSCQLGATHSTGTNSDANVGVSDTAGALPANQDVLFRVASGAASGSYIVPATVHGTFSVTAGSHTFYLLAQETSGAIDVLDSQLSVLFVPTSYGTVSPTVLARDGGDEYSPRVAPMSQAEIEAERAQSIAAEFARRDSEAAELRAMMETLRDQVHDLQQRLDERERPRAAPSADPVGVAYDGTKRE